MRTPEREDVQVRRSSRPELRDTRRRRPAPIRGNLELLERRCLLLLEQQSAAAALGDLHRVMDQYHNRFPVYDDVSSAGNHFHAWGKMGTTWTAWTSAGPRRPTPEPPRSRHVPQHDGAQLRRLLFPERGPARGSTAPSSTGGPSPAAGINLSGVTELTFWARGGRGETVEFFMGGVGRDPGSGAPTTPTPIPRP